MSELDPIRNCLHLVVSASESAVGDCLVHCLEGDSIVFLDHGVMHLLGIDDGKEILSRHQVSFSIVDLQARGLAGTARRLEVRLKDDRAIARLLLTHDHCLTWT